MSYHEEIRAWKSKAQFRWQLQGPVWAKRLGSLLRGHNISLKADATTWSKSHIFVKRLDETFLIVCERRLVTAEMLWGCRSEEVKDDSKLEETWKRRRWTEDRLLFLWGGQEPLSFTSLFFLLSHAVFTFFVPSTTPSLSHPCRLSLPPSLSETSSKWSPLANQPAAKICTTAFLFSLCLRACVIFQVFERVCPSWTFCVDPT